MVLLYLYNINIHNTHAEIGQIPLPHGAMVPSGHFSGEDLREALNTHYGFIVANVKVSTFITFYKQFALISLLLSLNQIIEEECAAKCAPPHLATIKEVLVSSLHIMFIIEVISFLHKIIADKNEDINNNEPLL